MKTLKDIQLKRGTSINLSNWNGVLKSGEPVFDYDNKLKIGDGVTHYNDLPYICYNPDEIDIIVQGLDNRIIDLETIVSILGTYIHYSNNTYKWDSSTILDANSGYKDDTSIDFVILSPALTAINKNTFSGCTSLKTIVFPESSLLTEIGESCFRNTSSLNNVVLPKTINKIGKNAFKGSEILYITIPNTNISSVGEDAFRDCVNLKEIELHCSGSVEIYGRTFSNCTSLKSVILSGITQMNQYSFENDTNIEYLSITDSNVETRYGQFQNCTNLKTAIITGVNRLAERTFYGCTSLSKVELSELIIEMGYYAFGNCTSLTDLVVPNTNNNSNNRIKNHALETSGITNLTLLNPNEQFESWSFDSDTKQRLTIYSYLDSVPQTLCSNLGINFKALLKDTIVDQIANSTDPITSRAVLNLSNQILQSNKVYMVDYNTPNYSEAQSSRNQGKLVLMYYDGQLYLCTAMGNSGVYGDFLQFSSVNPNIYPYRSSNTFTYTASNFWLLTNNTWVSASGNTTNFLMDTEILWAEYNSTSYNTIINAASANRLVLCNYMNESYIYYTNVPNQFVEFKSVIPQVHVTDNNISYSYKILHVTQGNVWSNGMTNYTVCNYSSAERTKLAGIEAGAEVNVQSNWTQSDNSADDYIKNKPSIINNTNSTSTTDVLSANIGKQLQDQITSLQAIGRFLSIWNCTIGLPESNPGSLPYSYQTGDYYIIGTTQSTIVEESISIEQTVGTSDLQLSVDLETYKDYYQTITGNQYDTFVYDGSQWLKNIFAANLADFGIEVTGTPQQGDTIQVTYIYPLLNYKPTGSSYNSVPSTTVETTEVQVGDVYLYDGTSWLFQLNHQRIIPVDSALDSSSTNPVENRVVANAINSKADISTTLSGYGITDANITSGVITLGSNTITPITAETDPVFSASPAATITSGMITAWNSAEQNVQSDWNQTDNTADDYIKNKPNLSTYAAVLDLTNVEYTTAAALNDLNSRIIANQYVITLDMTALLTDYPNLKVLYLRESSSSDSDDNISLSKFVAGKWLLLMGVGTFQCNIQFASGTSYSYTGIVRNDMSKSKLTVTKTGESGGQPTLSFTWS